MSRERRKPGLESLKEDEGGKGHRRMEFRLVQGIGDEIW